jgi:hypothetical protein
VYCHSCQRPSNSRLGPSQHTFFRWPYHTFRQSICYPFYTDLRRSFDCHVVSSVSQNVEGTYRRSISPSLTAVSWRVAAEARGRATAAESRADAGFSIGRSTFPIRRDIICSTLTRVVLLTVTVLVMLFNKERDSWEVHLTIPDRSQPACFHRSQRPSNNRRVPSRHKSSH